jgi:hypothetical protein
MIYCRENVHFIKISVLKVFGDIVAPTYVPTISAGEVVARNPIATVRQLSGRNK